jgi:hypothetical protein
MKDEATRRQRRIMVAGYAALAAAGALIGGAVALVRLVAGVR